MNTRSFQVLHITEKLTATNVQNQNANVDEKSFGGRIGEASDALLKKYALDYCMSEMARNNHLNNETYTHDLNNYAVGSHNCLYKKKKILPIHQTDICRDFLIILRVLKKD